MLPTQTDQPEVVGVLRSERGERQSGRVSSGDLHIEMPDDGNDRVRGRRRRPDHRPHDDRHLGGNGE